MVDIKWGDVAVGGIVGLLLFFIQQVWAGVKKVMDVAKLELQIESLKTSFREETARMTKDFERNIERLEEDIRELRSDKRH